MYLKHCEGNYNENISRITDGNNTEHYWSLSSYSHATLTLMTLHQRHTNALKDSVQLWAFQAAHEAQSNSPPTPCHSSLLHISQTWAGNIKEFLYHEVPRWRISMGTSILISREIDFCVFNSVWTLCFILTHLKPNQKEGLFTAHRHFN